MPPTTCRTRSARQCRELHSAGIEVILDVVYNHTAEGNHLGPTLCYRGIDNASYYWLVPDKPRFYENFTGYRQRAEAHASARAADGDGFAALLGRSVPRRRLPLRSRDHARPHAGVRSARAVLRRHPAGSGARQRQADRRAVGHRARRLPGRRLPARLVGMERRLSQDAAPLLARRRQPARRSGQRADRARPRNSVTTAAAPQASINHVTVHDGFTLADLVSYEHKHNEANGEDNRDGSDDNVSTNCGVEGPTDDPAILDERRLLRRNQLASLLLAQGVPLHPCRRRGRQQPGRQQQRLLPGQRDRLGGLVGARAASART